MNSENVKKENRKALPKFFLVIFLSAVGGGVLGFCSGMAGASSLPEAVINGIHQLLRLIIPWGIPVSGVVLLGAAFAMYRRARGLVRGWDGEDETAVDRAEELLNWAMLWTSLATILGFFFLAASTIREDDSLMPLVVVGEFIAAMAVTVLLQQRVVDLERTLNPEKKGSVYDMKFQKKWFESCDEAERAQIGQASYKAFKAANNTCIFTWLALILLSYVFDLGLMPVFAVMVIWGVLQVTYTLECIRLSRKK